MHISLTLKGRQCLTDLHMYAMESSSNKKISMNKKMLGLYFSCRIINKVADDK